MRRPTCGDYKRMARVGACLLIGALGIAAGARADETATRTPLRVLATAPGQEAPGGPVAGAAGPNGYVQVTALHAEGSDSFDLQVFDKTTLESLATQWIGTALAELSHCSTYGTIDELRYVDYDREADRWAILTPFPQACVGVSSGSDPLAPGWFAVFTVSLLGSVPQGEPVTLASWPGYYVVAGNDTVYGVSKDSLFQQERSWSLFVGDITGLAGAAGGRFVPVDPGGRPRDPDGPVLVLRVIDDERFSPDGADPTRDFVEIWEIQPGVECEGYACIGNPIRIPVTDLDTDLCGGAACIPQPGGGLLGAAADRPGAKAQYRDFGTHESILVTQTVDVDGSDHAGLRWYELRRAGGDWFLFQEGALPVDALHRFWGSAVMDASGDVLLVYMASDATTGPVLRVAGHAHSDAPGDVSGEIGLTTGAGALPTGWTSEPWISLDPSDDCTFFVTGLEPTVPATRIASLRFDGCGSSHDYGDAPAPYPTLRADGGAFHGPGGPHLGSQVDPDADGQPSADASGDGADEDGVAFIGTTQAGATAYVDVTAARAGRLDAWVDMAGDGDWSDSGDQIAQDVAVPAGTTRLSFGVPASAKVGTTFARFRISQAGGLGFGGGAPDGEVEDHALTIAPAAGTLYDPPPGSQLSSTTVTFRWAALSGATKYWLQVSGTKPGGREIFDSATTATSVQVGGLPTGAVPVYVRLWALVGGAWSHSDYVYTAVDARASEMIAPTPGTELPGTSQAFTWTTGVGVTKYWLQVSRTKPGGREIFDASTTATSQEVGGLPTGGVPVYVRLWSLLLGRWVFVDYTYAATSSGGGGGGGGGTGGAELTTPVPGSVLPLGPVTFAWTAGGGSEYFLQVGASKPGSHEIFSANVGSATSQEVSGIPGGGVPIYVRLWSRVGGTWQKEDYTFVAPDGRAEMISPTPGTKLTGASVTFQWTTGAGVQSYWLQIGTSKAGSREILDTAVAGTSLLVSGLPTNGASVYVRLWSKIGGRWYTYDYVYVAAGP